MAVLDRIPKAIIRARYKHKALAFGIVPVYFSSIEDPEPDVAVRNWVPEWTLDLTSWVYFAFFDLVDPMGAHERPIPFIITGKVK